MREDLGIFIGTLIIIIALLGLGWAMGRDTGTRDGIEQGTSSAYEEYKDVICTKPDLTIDQKYKLKQICNFK